ncbi:MAG: RNA polymerase sigma factor [Acidimicrobiales bacterium]
MAHDPSDDAALVRSAQAGDSRAFSILFERWFDRSYDVAWRIVRNRDTAQEVAQETFMAAWTKLDTLRDAEAFGGWILRTSRNKALNRLERERRGTTMETQDTVDAIDRQRPAVDVAEDVVRQEQADLVWAASAALGERDASILDLYLRHDCDPAEIAVALDVTPNAAHQTLFRLRKRLEGAIRAWVLWNDGHPQCGVLVDVLEAGGVDTFGATAVKVISRHVAECDECDTRNAVVLAPASMFAAVPLVAVGVDVRRAAASSLAERGVPIDPALVGPTDVSGIDADEAPSSVRRRIRAMAGAVAVLVVLGVTVAVGVGLLDDGTATMELVATPPSPDPEMGTATTSEPTTTSASEPTTIASPDPAPPADDLVPETTRPEAPPVTTVPPVAPPPPPPPVPPTPAPTIVSVVGGIAGPDPACEVGQSVYEISWQTTDADRVVVTGFGSDTTPRPATGSTSICGFTFELVDQVWTVTAEGSGGSTSVDHAFAP